MDVKKNIAIFGSTGSIGKQTLDVIRHYPQLFRVHTLSAGNNADLLIEQAKEFMPDVVVIANDNKYKFVKEALNDLPIKVYAGAKALAESATNSYIDVVVSALVGFSGLQLTINAINSSKVVALANKETLVVAGSLIIQLAKQKKVPILPIDSEHSAIFQSCQGSPYNKPEKILLTASGGPFRDFSDEQLMSVTASQALQHPNWKMGPKITIDSATLMNKGFEMIEAKWLFDVEPKNIEVVVHRESIIHSAVQFEDGAIIAQLGSPDMRLPIQYALTYPYRLPMNTARLDLFKLASFHFERPNRKLFPCLDLAYDAIQKGGNVPCIMNAANEVANLAFRNGQIAFSDIPKIIEKSIEKVSYIENITLEDIIATDNTSRDFAKTLIR